MGKFTEQIAREIIKRLDAQNALLADIYSQLAQQGEQQSAGYIQQAGKVQSLLELLIAQFVPCSPQITREVTINAVTPTLLYENLSLPFQRIEITDDDPAQMCWIGKRNVSMAMGRVLLAQNSVVYVLPQGDELWAICAVATISLRISEGFDLVGGTQVIRGSE